MILGHYGGDMVSTAIVSFASPDLRWTLRRLRVQAIELGTFDFVWTWSLKDLDPAFRATFQPILKKDVRGFGYWAWKPQVILQAMALLSDGDVLLYVDSGCHLNVAGKEKMEAFFERVLETKSGILGTQMDVPEKYWTKADLANFMGVQKDSRIMETGQMVGGVIFFRVTNETRNFVNTWLRVFEENLSLVDDSPSEMANPIGFKEHRHDQSVFSILAKKADIDTFPQSDIWVPNKEWSKLADSPIQVRRDSHTSPLKKRLKKMGKKFQLFKKVRRVAKAIREKGT